ncbi:hypothetical protein [Lacipirellula parvula]|uniref:Uncharacterized protein n=1 Tax=Lacipirellula parvula TaxID=2650471 RepID=A0A5K7X8F9_9BACT|nr:hypothetical protein [Lacipirellula parvula]BBO32920.1 hypothetical protein PLANPX_2532 [Lacipirellula parvula]
MPEEPTPEIELTFEPIPQALADLGISAQEFEAALAVALEAFDDDSSIEEAPIIINGVEHELVNVARIFVRGEIQTLREMFSPTDVAD